VCRTSPLRVVAGRARPTFGVLSRSVQPAALTLRTRCFGGVVRQGVPRTLFCADRSGAGPAFPPRYKPDSPGSRRSGRALEKAYFAKRSPAARPKGKCCRVNPSPLRILTIIGRVMRGEEGLPGDSGPVSCHAPLVFIKLLTLSTLREWMAYDTDLPGGVQAIKSYSTARYSCSRRISEAPAQGMHKRRVRLS
jgi:hypothetical protein